MAMGAYQTSKFGPVYTHATNSMRRKPFLIALVLLFLVALFYVPHSPEALSSYTHVKIPSTFTDGIISKPSSESNFPDSFPKKIWQTGSQSMKEKWAEQTETWTSMNEEWNYELLTDDSNTLFVEDRFKDRPALLAFWRDLNVTILRADFVRYLSMLADGGVYSDMDTSCIKPIEQWIPSYFDESAINAVVGVEYDDNTYKMFVRPVSFCQWTLMAKPGHPIFEAVVARVVYHLEYLARIQNTDLAGLKVGKKEVLEATGPGAFTDAVMENLSNTLGRKVEWSEVQGLKEPTLFGDVLILPINGFGSGQKHSHSSDPEYGDVLAKHHFGRSWYYRPPDPVESLAPSATEAPAAEPSEAVLTIPEPTEAPVVAPEQVEESSLGTDPTDSTESEAGESETETQADETPV